MKKLEAAETMRALAACGKADFKWVLRNVFDMSVVPTQAQAWTECRNFEDRSRRPGGKIKAQRHLGQVKPAAELLIRKDRHGGQIILTSIGRVSDAPHTWRLVDGQHRLHLVAKGNTHVYFTVRLYHCATEKDAAALFAMSNDFKKLQPIDKLKALWANEHSTVCYMVKAFPSPAPRNPEELALFSRNWSGRHPNASQILTAIHVALFREKSSSGVFDAIYNAGLATPGDVDLFKSFWEPVDSAIEELPEDERVVVRPIISKIEVVSLLFAYWVGQEQDDSIIRLALRRMSQNLEWRQKVKKRNPSKEFSQWSDPITDFAYMLYPSKSRTGDASAGDMRRRFTDFMNDCTQTGESRREREASSNHQENNLNLKIRKALSLQDSLTEELGDEDDAPVVLRPARRRAA